MLVRTWCVVVSLEKYHDTHRRLRLFGVLESIAGQKEKEKDNQKDKEKNNNSKKRLIVQTVENDPILRRFLEMELFPSIQFQQQV